MKLIGLLTLVAPILASPVFTPPANNKDLVLPFAIIGDLDAASRDEDKWYSPMSIGTLALSANRSSAFIYWMSSHNYTTKLNYNMRAMELSDLKYFNGNLMTVDDKTGIIYRLDGKKAIPWVILANGDSTDEDYFKGEWLTVKDGYLYCGGVGKEWTTRVGEYINDNPMFVKRITPEGAVFIENWLQHYIDLRAAIDIHFPGYVIHEAVQWSDLHKKWFFLPRHMSKLAYNDKAVFETGANVLLTASDDFKVVTATPIGQEVLTRGFSAFQFIPGTNDEVIAAIRTEEIHGKPFSSYLMVFTVGGEIILDELRIPGDLKYEGIEFLYEPVASTLTATAV